MADEILYSFKTEADFRGFQREAADFTGTLEEFIDLLKKYKAAIGDVGNNTAVVEVKSKVSGIVELGRVASGLTDIEKAERNVERSTKQRLKADQDSLRSTQQRLSQAKQELNLMGRLDSRYSAQAARVRELEIEYRRLNGIQAGSVADIKAETQALQDRLRNENLSSAARQELTEQIQAYSLESLKAQGVEEGSIQYLKAQQAEQQRLVETLAAGSAEQQRASEAVRNYSKQIEAATPKTLTFFGALNKIATLQAGLTAIGAAIGVVSGSINKVVNRVKQVESFNLAFQNLGLSAIEASKYFGLAADSAAKLGAPLEQVEKTYKRIVPALLATGASSEEARKFIDNLTARTQTLGLSTEEAGRYFEAFAQVLSKGRLQGEELNQQISELDGAFRVQFAQAIGVTTEELNKLVEQGSVTSGKLISGFTQMSNGVEQLAGNVATGNQTIQQLQNNIARIQTKTLESIGVAIEPGIRALLRATEAFALFVQKIVDSPVGELLFNIFNQVAQTVENVVRIFTDLALVIVDVLSPLAGLINLFTPFLSTILTIVTVFKTAEFALIGFTKGLDFVAAGLSKTKGGFAQVITATGNFGKAIKSLFSLKLEDFLNNLVDGIDNLLRALKTSTIDDFANALNRVRNVEKGGGGLNVVAESIDAISDAANGSNGPLGKLEFNAANGGKNLKNLGNASVGSSKKVGLFSQVLDVLGGDLKLTDIRLGKSGTAAKKVAITYENAGQFLLKSGGAARTSAAAYGAAGTAAAGAGAGAGVAALAVGILAAKLFLVTAAISAVVGFFSGFFQATNAAKEGIKKTNGELKELGILSKSAKGPISSLVDLFFTWIIPVKPLVALFKKISDTFAILGGRLGFAENLEAMRVQFDAVNKAAKKAGLGSLIDFSNAAKVSGKDAQALVSALGSLARGAEAAAAQTDKQIQKLKEEDNYNKQRVKELEKQRDQYLNIAADYRYAEGALAALTAEQRKNNKEVKDSATAVEISKKAIQERNEILSQANTKLATQAQEEYNKGLITEGDLQLKTAAYAAESSKLKQKAVEEELAYIRTLRGTEGVEREALRARERELIQQSTEAAKEAATAQTALFEAQKNKIKEVAEAAENLASIYGEAASIAASSFDTLGGAVTGALGELKQTIASQAALEFRFTGDGSVIERAIGLQGRILQIEYQIGRTKAEINKAQRDFELQMIALKTQQIILEAKAGPDTAAARAVVAAGERQLQIIGQVGQLNNTIYSAERLALDSKTQRLQTAQNIVRQTLGLPPLEIVEQKSVDTLIQDFANLADQAQADMANIGPAIVSAYQEGTAAGKEGFDEVANVAKDIQQSLEKFNEELVKGIEAITESAKELATKNYGVALGKELAKAFGSSLDKFSEELKKSPEQVQNIKNATADVGKAWKDSTGNVKNFNTEVDKTNKLIERTSGLLTKVPNLTNVRAMGGPVASGSTYLVNDGGGRESFVDKFNNVKLLPAGRNIRWRAPSDGYVIPAPMTESLIQNSKINAKIASINDNLPRANPSMAATGVSNSGNLIKQMGAAMGGNTTQRITNHVTIQSQSPVSDASRIMANVARLRARRGIMS